MKTSKFPGRIQLFAPIFLVLCLITAPTSLFAAEPSEESFQATWKLLNSEQKQQFIAGYLYGWRDAAKVTDVAIDYVESNPTKAVDSLKKIRGLYAMSDMSPAALSVAVDGFYTDPDNHKASLSQAISSARGGGVAAR